MKQNPSLNASLKRGLWLGLFYLILVFGHGQSKGKLFQSSYGKIHFVSDAPLELIEATSESLKGLIDLEKRSFAFTLPMNSFEGFNSPLQQEHYNEKYLETEKFPVAKFSGKIIENISLDQSEIQEVRAKGILEIHGIGTERIIKGKLQVQENKIQIAVDFSIPLADHDIQIPKVVYQKIAEHIQVHVEIIMENK